MACPESWCSYGDTCRWFIALIRIMVYCQPQHCVAGVTYDTARVLQVITNHWLEVGTHYVLY